MKRTCTLPLLLLLVPFTCLAQTSINAAAVYWPVLSNVTAWSAQHGGVLVSNATAQDQASAYAALQPELARLQTAQTATGVDWGTKFDDGIAAILPHVGPAMKTQKAAIWAAGYAFSNRLAEAVDWAAEGIRVARNVGENGTILDLLVQIGGEKKMLDLLRANAGSLSPAQRALLLDGLARMPAGGDSIGSMQMEKALFVDAMIRQVLKAYREADTNLFEIVDAANAADTNLVAGTDTNAHPPAAANASWFARNLRLASIVDTGSGWKIGFETTGGDSFVVSLGRPQRGIELLTVDYEREEALIVRQGETALVRMRQRDISPVRLRLRLPTPEELRAGSAVDAAKLPEPARSVRAVFEGFGATGDSTASMEAFLAATGGTGEGLVAYLKRTSDEYGEWIEAARTRSPGQFKEWQKSFLPRTTVLTKLLMPAIDKVLDKEGELNESRRLLIDALSRPPVKSP